MIRSKPFLGMGRGIVASGRRLALLLGAISLCAPAAWGGAAMGLARPPAVPTAAFSLSHIGVHATPSVPAHVMAPLGDESLDRIVKGYDITQEERLAQALLACGLDHRLLRVASVSGPEGTVALVKLQAGHKRTGAMSLRGLHRDVLTACRTVFSISPTAASVDVWAVVPETRDDVEERHHPVFSTSVRGATWRGSVGDSPTRQLSGFGVLRYAPSFLQYCPETLTVEGLRANLPSGAFTDWPRSQYAAELVQRGRDHLQSGAVAAQARIAACESADKSRPIACLTIDDGPHPLITPWVLDILRQYDAKATFFLVGSQVEHYPELAARIAEEGHELANHTYSHQRLNELRGGWAWAEIKAAEEAIERVTAAKTRFFRPPGGRCTAETLRIASSMGYVTALWTHNTGDWRNPAPDSIVSAATREAEPGAVIMMHQDNVPSCIALPAVLKHYADLGLEFVTLSEGIGSCGAPQVRPRELLPRLNRANL
jgi:peptidoglycan/xylan/chitin deacetylase (PgdA/CDA1 family)